MSTILNEPAYRVNEAIEDFFSDRAPDDFLLLYLSCHGVKDEAGDLYFAMADTKLRRLAATAVGADYVNRRMNRSRSRSIALLLDCCYAGAFDRGMVPRAGSAIAVEELLAGRGRAVITSSSAIEYAFEELELVDAGDARPSVFTSALVEGLATGNADIDQDGLIALDELYDYVYQRVRQATPNQTPGKWTFGGQGELYIAWRKRPVAQPAPLPRELAQMLDNPLAGARHGAIYELERLLQGRHAGLALAAKMALERLVDDDSRMVSVAASSALERSTSPMRYSVHSANDSDAVNVEDVSGAPSLSDKSFSETRQAVPPAPPNRAPAKSRAGLARSIVALRLIAWLIDTALVAAGLFVMVAIGVAIALPFGAVGMHVFSAAFYPLAFVGPGLYYTLLETSPWQGTFGKRLLGLSVTDVEHRRITFARASARYVCKILSVALLGLGLVTIALPERRTVHDMITGTVVRYE